MLSFMDFFKLKYMIFYALFFIYDPNIDFASETVLSIYQNHYLGFKAEKVNQTCFSW